MTKEEFIFNYVKRARECGFRITETPNGCIYEADDGIDLIGSGEFVAAPCDCGHCDGWGMFPQEQAA